MNASLIRVSENSYSLLYQQKHLHSVRNPWQEAERLIHSQMEASKLYQRISDKRSPVFFLINPGLGHAAVILRKRYSKAVIHAVYSDESLYQFVLNCRESMLAPEEMIPAINRSQFKQYLLSNLTGLSVFSTQLINWLPASYLPGHDRLLKEYLAAIREKQADILTRMYFGRRWIQNVRSNIHRLRKPKNLGTISGPVVLCASGPSLGDSLPLLREIGSRVHIWALPSALRALRAERICPDCIVSSDGGYWAGPHLRFAPEQSHLIMALSSRVPANLFDNRKSAEFISLQMPFIQNAQPFMELPERASVIFTTLDILARLDSDPVIIFGADFDTRELQTHIRPHTFDEFIESTGNRLHPLSTERFRRSTGGQLNLYAEWFRTEKHSEWPTLYRWRGEGAELPIPEIQTRDELMTIINALPAKNITWKGGSKTTQIADIIAPIPHPLPENLFSKEHRSLREILIYTNGIEFKNQYLQWLSGKTEHCCVRELEQVLVEDGA